MAGFRHCPGPDFAGAALGHNAYAEFEAAFFKNSPALVAFDNLLTPAVLSSLREVCEEATAWKSYFENGYCNRRVNVALPFGKSPNTD